VQISLLDAEVKQLRQQLQQSVADDSISARLEQALRTESVKMDSLRDSVTGMQNEVRAPHQALSSIVSS
jgi:hypothetical protein